MGYFLAVFALGNDAQMKIAIKDFEDTAMLEAWYALLEHLFEGDNIELLNKLEIASESDEPLEAFKAVELIPNPNVDEVIKVISFAEILEDEYSQLVTTANLNIANEMGDMAIYIAKGLVANNLVLHNGLVSNPHAIPIKRAKSGIDHLEITFNW